MQNLQKELNIEIEVVSSIGLIVWDQIRFQMVNISVQSLFHSSGSTRYPRQNEDEIITCV